MDIKAFLPKPGGLQKKILPILPLALVGFAIGRIPGAVIGLVIGYFLGELWSQLDNDRMVRAYFENPGPIHFYEGEPGLAAFCALGIFIVSKAQPRALGHDAAAVRVAGGALSVFPQGKKIEALAESFCRLALSCQNLLNPDLLTESLAARRHDAGDLPLLGSELASMAMGREARQEALYIRQFLDPSYQPPPPDYTTEDPWKVLGISPGASQDEIKSAFRQLALMFHPDNQMGLSEEERKRTGDAFMKIRDAYHELMRDKE
jgi:DnaJ like chaperone protein